MSHATGILFVIALVVIVVTHVVAYVVDRRAHRKLDEEVAAALNLKQAPRRGRA